MDLLGSNNVEFLSGGNRTGDIIRNIDWVQNPLGNTITWAESLRACTRIMLAATNPVLIIWGPEDIMLFNDPFADLLNLQPGNALGISAATIWADWEILRAGITTKGELQLTDGSTGNRYNFTMTSMPDSNGSAGFFGMYTQIAATDAQKMAIQKIEESRQKASLAIEGAELGTFDYYPQTRTLIWSARTKSFFGLEPDHPVTVETFLEGLHPDDRLPSEELLTSSLSGAGDGKYENVYRTIGFTDRKLRWIRSKGRAHFNEQGEAIRFSGVTQDITKQKEAEALNQKLVALIEASREFIGLANIDSSIEYGNPAALQMLGWRSTKGRQIIDLVYPDDHRLAYEMIPTLLKKGFFEREIRFYNEETGKPFWIQWNCFAITDPRSKDVIGFGTVSTNIEERKKNEMALIESEARFRSLADHSPMFIFTVEPVNDAHVNYFNQTFYDYIGEDSSAALGISWGNYLHADDVPKVVEIFNSALSEKRPYVIEGARIRRHDGQYRWHSFKGNPRFAEDGSFLGYIGVGFDIHERKLAEESLQESEERFRTLVHKLPQLVWVADSDGRKEFTSERWDSFFGRSGDYEFEWDEIIMPEDLTNWLKVLSDSFQSGRSFRLDVRLRNKKGEFCWHSAIGEPVIGTDGKILKWIGAFSDIHHDKIFSQELEQQVQSRTNELRVKNQDLEKMNKELESFAYISSHDLQEPLRKIQTFASRIIDSEFGKLSESGQAYFLRIQDAAHRMQTLIVDLLAYSRTNVDEREFEVHDLGVFIEELLEEFSDELVEKEADVKLGSVCKVGIIPLQFRQLLQNLLGNSLKFSKPGVKPFIYFTSEIIKGSEIAHPKSNSELEYCKISMTDNGIGFPPEYGEKIFEVFQRLHSKDRYSGTGIGLAIVKRIIENHNGMIMATGKVGEGAKFDIYLPL